MTLLLLLCAVGEAKLMQSFHFFARGRLENSKLTGRTNERRTQYMCGCVCASVRGLVDPLYNNEQRGPLVSSGLLGGRLTFVCRCGVLLRPLILDQSSSSSSRGRT